MAEIRFINLGLLNPLITASSAPTGDTSRLWLDTSETTNVLKFYNGSNWVSTRSDSIDMRAQVIGDNFANNANDVPTLSLLSVIIRELLTIEDYSTSTQANPFSISGASGLLSQLDSRYASRNNAFARSFALDAERIQQVLEQVGMAFPSTDGSNLYDSARNLLFVGNNNWAQGDDNKLAGTNIANDSIGSNHLIADDSLDSNRPVNTNNIRDGAITTAKINPLVRMLGRSNGLVMTADIGDDQVTTDKIGDDQVTTAKIGDDQVTTAKIANDQVTTAKIANDQVPQLR